MRHTIIIGQRMQPDHRMSSTQQSWARRDEALSGEDSAAENQPNGWSRRAAARK